MEKKYNEAVNKLRKLLDLETVKESGKVSVDHLKQIFPELAETEDERIKRILVDFFSKGAEKGETTNGIPDKDILVWLEKQHQSSQVLVEKDEKIGENLINAINSSAQLSDILQKHGFNIDELVTWLENQNAPIKWKQENAEDLSDFESAMMHIGGSFFGEHQGLDPNDTAVIKEQANVLLGMVNREWNEEDEEASNEIGEAIYDYWPSERANKLVKWLKSPHPQRPGWKPSEEQIKALEKAIKCGANYYNITSALELLFNDLKEL